MLYQAYQTQNDLLAPFRLLAQSSSAALWLDQTEGSMVRKMSAAMDVFSRLRLTHARPAYGITSVKVGERELAVTEESILTLPRICINGGRRGYLVGIDPQVCVQLLGAQPVNCALAE